jgi:hypothetical protein
VVGVLVWREAKNMKMERGCEETRDVVGSGSYFAGCSVLVIYLCKIGLGI